MTISRTKTHACITRLPVNWTCD